MKRIKFVIQTMILCSIFFILPINGFAESRNYDMVVDNFLGDCEHFVEDKTVFYKSAFTIRNECVCLTSFITSDERITNARENIILAEILYHRIHRFYPFREIEDSSISYYDRISIVADSIERCPIPIRSR